MFQRKASRGEFCMFTNERVSFGPYKTTAMKMSQHVNKRGFWQAMQAWKCVLSDKAETKLKM